MRSLVCWRTRFAVFEEKGQGGLVWRFLGFREVGWQVGLHDVS